MFTIAHSRDPMHPVKPGRWSTNFPCHGKHMKILKKNKVLEMIYSTPDLWANAYFQFTGVIFYTRYLYFYWSTWLVCFVHQWLQLSSKERGECVTVRCLCSDWKYAGKVLENNIRETLTQVWCLQKPSKTRLGNSLNKCCFVCCQKFLVPCLRTVLNTFVLKAVFRVWTNAAVIYSNY